MEIKPGNSNPETRPLIVRYGCETFSRLTCVMLHRPDRMPESRRLCEEHDRYRQLLESLDIKVLELSDYIERSNINAQAVPYSIHLHHIATICSSGAVVGSAAAGGRSAAPAVVQEALRSLGIPILIEAAEPGDGFAGCILLSPLTVLAAVEAGNRSTMLKVASRLLEHFQEVVCAELPERRHPGTIYNRVSARLGMAYLPALQQVYSVTRGGIERIDFVEHMRRRGIEIINVSDSEHRRLACAFIPLEPGVIIQCDGALDAETQHVLARTGAEIIFFRSKSGNWPCKTLRLHREHQVCS